MRAMIRVLTGAKLIDGTGAVAVPDAAVVVDGDRVVAAGARGALSWPNDAEVIDVHTRQVVSTTGSVVRPAIVDIDDRIPKDERDR